ncbi:MAG: Fic family protein [Eubacteriales bacterium]|nr:Fic family protein [Eubacteriales bacterium]
MTDKYCYPNSDVLKNKKNIITSSELLAAETEYTSIRLLELQRRPIRGSFDFKHLCKIHQYIFQDLYGWAGKPRTVDIEKGYQFCLVQYIPNYASQIFSDYYSDCKSAKHDCPKFIYKLTEHYSDLNALHPFREGNGRAQREFARELCFDLGYIFDLTHTCHKDMLNASIASFSGNNKALEEIFKTAVIPIKNYEKYQGRPRRSI